MDTLYYIGLDVHKRKIAYCIKDVAGRIIKEGFILSQRKSIHDWLKTLSTPWIGAMEATMFTGWIYDYLKPHADELKVAHPEMLKAIIAGKKKNDRADAAILADLLRTNLLPECYMLPQETRELRRILRYRNFVMRMGVKTKNKISGLLMEVGAQYDKQRIHGKKYFHQYLERVEDVPESVISLLKMSRANLELFKAAQKRLISVLRGHNAIRERVERLMTIPGVGEILALTWVLEVGDPNRFSNIAQAVSYCGLCSAQKESAGKSSRGPISKKRNNHLQCILVEAAKIAPLWNEQLAEIHKNMLAKAHRNTATLAVARKLVAYLLAVDKGEKPFAYREQQMAA